MRSTSNFLVCAVTIQPQKAYGGCPGRKFVQVGVAARPVLVRGCGSSRLEGEPLASALPFCRARDGRAGRALGF